MPRVLSSSTYNDAELVNCDFYKSDLSYTEFSNATLNGVRFARGDFWEADFKKGYDYRL